MKVKCEFCQSYAARYFKYYPVLTVYALCKNCCKEYSAKAKYRITKEEYLLLIAMEAL
jgi:hypothetical protein